MFGVHIPEVQLDMHELHAAFELASLVPDEHFVDLGCGLGETLLVAGREFGAIPRGVEILPDVAQAARERLTVANVEGTVEVADLATVDLTDSDVVLLHLSPAFYDLLADHLYAQLAPTARVVTARWPVPGWHVLDTVRAGETDLYLHQPTASHAALTTNLTPGRLVRALPTRATVVDSLTIQVHAPLHALSCQFTGSVAPVVRCATDTRHVHRGQTLPLHLDWDLRGVPAGSRLAGYVTPVGRDFSDREVVGAPVPIDVTVTGN